MIRKFNKVIFVPAGNGGKYPHCHSLFVDDDVKVLIDPASDQKRLEALKREKGVDVIINSHYHEDHFMYNYLFPDAELYVPKADAPCFQSLDKLLEFYGTLSTALEEDWRKYMKDMFNFRERIPSREFVDGETFNFGTTIVEIVHTPGHTPGHSCLFFKEEELLFLADIDLTPFGPWYGDASSNLEQTIASIKLIRDFPARTFITAHGEGIVQGGLAKKADEFLRVIEQRENALLDFLREPRSMEEIVKKWIIYKKPREPVKFYEFGERGMIMKHVDRLLKRGAIVFQDGRYERRNTNVCS